VAADSIETADEVASVISQLMKYVPKDKIIVSTNCGMAPMQPDVAWGKLAALGQGAELARLRYG
jgi:5-methyltetrahydropteroyltriglutamate--homocysteine methyltransferase